MPSLLPLKHMTLAVIVICFLLPNVNAEADNVVEERDAKASEQAENDLTLPKAVVIGTSTENEIKFNNVYKDNVTNLYIDRDKLERFQTSNPGDIFKGLNGVYSMDSRNGSSITPNVRGLSGEGRVPLTIDGTEQSTNVWLQLYGAGNRNYVDPALFRSVTVEKGPSLSRDVKSGVGGAVSVRTLEPSDIVPENDTFGFEFKAETSGNTTKPKVDANSYFGMDYRDIPGSVLGNDNNVNIPQPVPRDKSDKDILNFDDHAEMFVFAARSDLADFLVAYSQREKGNYFAGKKGASKYTNNDAYAQDTSAYFPNLTKLYFPGNEILSTSSNSKTTLVKNNWYLNNAQKIGLSFMRSDLRFAETGVGQSVAMLGFAEELAKKGVTEQLVAEFPSSKLQLDTYKLSYAWQPEDQQGIDLKTNVWMSQTDGTRHQSGGGAYYIKPSAELDGYNTLKADWDACRAGPDWANGLPSGAAATDCFTNPNLNINMGATAPVEPDHDGHIFAGSSQWTDHNRTGFDVSNLMVLSNNLRLTLGGSYQQEKLKERVADVKLTGGIGVGGANFHDSTTNYGPRSGDRDEYSGMFSFEWTPMQWLSLTAGARYNRYSSFDEGLAERRRQQVASAQATKHRVGIELEYGEILSDSELATYRVLEANQSAASSALTSADWDSEVNDGITTPNLIAWRAALAALDAFKGDGLFLNQEQDALYRTKKVLVPIVNGKVDSSQSPLSKNPINPGETVTNPQGQAGEYAKTIPNKNSVIYEDIAADQQWAAPEKQSGHAWSPIFSATARITPYSTAFFRYAQTTRFPSIFEVASTSMGMGVVGELSIEGATKPERSTNWEVGYSHDLTQLFHGLYVADLRLSYFNTTIEDFIERDPSLTIIQFDKKKTSGIEFQSRFDSGHFFGGLGATYRLKQELCDEDYAYGMDPFYNRMPKCMSGGFPDTLTATSLQPKQSIDTELGTRFFNERLELGWRAVYHAKAENKQLNDLLNTSYGKDVWREQSMRQMFWHSVMLHDLYARWNVQKNLVMNVGITNVTDRYYMDPMSKIPVPGPGRTVTMGLSARF